MVETLVRDVGFEPADSVLNQGELVGTEVRQFRWWLIKREYFVGRDPGPGYEAVEGLRGPETVITTIHDASEWFPNGVDPYRSWYTRLTPGYLFDLENPTDPRVAAFCNKLSIEVRNPENAGG